MKKILAVLMLAFALMISGARAQYLPSMDVILVGQTPNPVEPGQSVNIQLKIQNDGYGEAQNMVVEFVPNEPFGLLQGENAKRTISKIPGAGSLTTTYRLYVESSAVSNDYELEFRVYSATTPENYIKKTVTVSVQGVSQLVIQSISTIPRDVEPGGVANILFNITNVGTGVARGLKLTLSSSTEKITPVYSSSLIYIGDVKPNETIQADIEVSIDSSAEYKTYTTALVMTYKNENNQEQTSTLSVGIPVMGSIKLSIVKITPNYEKNRIDVELANKGTTDATSLESRLVIDGETVDVDYLSTLKATKKTTLSYPLILKGSGQLVIDYVGPGLKPNQVKMDVVFDFVPQGSDSSGFYLFLIVAAAAFVAWRKKWLHKLDLLGLFKKK